MADVGAWLSNAWDYYFGDSTNKTQLGNQQVRAYGVDPATGKLTAPQYGPSASAAGYDPADPWAFIMDQQAKVAAQFAVDDARNYADLTRSGTGLALPDLSNLSTSGGLLFFGLVLVIVFLVFKAVK